jgi:hypothetical protein
VTVPELIVKGRLRAIVLRDAELLGSKPRYGFRRLAVFRHIFPQLLF